MTKFKKIAFTPNETEKEIQLRSDAPYIEFVNLIVYNKNSTINETIESRDIIISFETFGSEFREGRILLNYCKIEEKFLVDNQINVNWNKTKSIKIKIQNYSSSEFGKMVLYYKDFNLIENYDSKKDFSTHLEDHKNQKILFSAPFGEGKSTFLKYFFEQNEDKYEVFKVFPVNYSVASNEDIFRYIKADILFQMMGKDVEFKKEVFSTELTAQQYVVSNFGQIAKSLIKAGLSVSSKTEGIVKAINKIEELIADFKTFHENTSKDEKKETLKYIEELYEQEGSLFEDNFYTQLIRELVEQIKLENKKETVLIIDDLDRMDPDHIFRILNVISAHCDTYNIQGEEFYNKFGFDKIIVVCDIDNIRSIFEHRYGKKVHFEGYINKMYSSEVFKYDGSVLIDYCLNSIAEKASNHSYRKSLHLLKVLYDIKLLTPRDLIKTFSDLDLESISRDYYLSLPNRTKKMKIAELTMWPTIHKLITLYGRNNLLSRLNEPNVSKTLQIDNRLNYLCEQLLLGLLPNNFDDSKSHYVRVNGRRFIIEVGYNYRDLYIKSTKIELVENLHEDYEFKESDFFELFIKNIKLL
jgi:hypothetical protein